MTASRQSWLVQTVSGMTISRVESSADRHFAGVSPPVFECFALVPPKKKEVQQPDVYRRFVVRLYKFLCVTEPFVFHKEEELQ